MRRYEKIITTILTAFKIILFTGTVVFAVLFYLSGKAERNYQNAKASMNKGDWSSALSFIEKIPHYKDSTELYSYIYPNKLYYDKYSTAEEAINNYSRIIFYIETEKDNLKKRTDAKYVDDLLELEKVLKFKITALNAKAQDEAVKNIIKDSIILIKQGNFDKAIEKLQGISDSGIYGPEKKQLLSFIELQNAINTKDEKLINGIIGKLNPNYKGDLAEDIKSVVQNFVDMEKWNEIYAKANGIAVTSSDDVQVQPQPQNSNITAGMKKEEVIGALGNPISENVISNKYGNFVDMVYNNDVHIYLENNIVIGVKG
ncbi:hypothetical protein [Fonticella tunisiensis]|uniref:Uncharacterized protein n=1 Tax=Fonticella tunisiensis TaxID=1096341 RepID=A0A4R7KPP2_9CLOT|nr:hypothetical protein [Fonticella tunisiensis]TDT56518.1 hypothetical protein EDD71_11362 [Fonticella tunisiensis]